MKTKEQLPNQYNYITSANGVRLTERQWAKRFLGLMAEDNFRRFMEPLQKEFTQGELERIERIVLEYIRLLISRRGFEFPAEYTPKVMKFERHRLIVDG